MHKSAVAVLVAALAAASSWNALAADPAVNHRQHRQEHRIEQGVRSGELTTAETKGLRKEERSIRQEERAYKSDGKLTRAERKDLHHDLNQASKDIYREKHDDEKRPRAQ
jgi:hypothetical protein